MTIAKHPPSLSGTVVDYRGAPISGALLVVTDLATGARIASLDTNDAGVFNASLKAGEYAIAVASDRGYSFIEKQLVPAIGLHLVLNRDCHSVTGHAQPNTGSTYATFTRRGPFTGDAFWARVGDDGKFSVCLPPAHYQSSLSGSTLSLYADVAVPAKGDIVMSGYASDSIHRPPPVAGVNIRSDSAALVGDVVRRKSTIIGLGEATHGTAEFASMRAQLTLELIKHANVRLLLFELDAITSVQLDDYVNGKDVDVAKAVAALKFWTTDTYEFLAFLDQIRQYNTTADTKVHIWGVDVQDTLPPSEAILSSSMALPLSEAQRSVLLRSAAGDGKGIKELTSEEKADLGDLLARLSTPMTAERSDLLVAVAARSLLIQFQYWEGPSDNYGNIRDRGMASMSAFIASRFSPNIACLWAHDAHISKQSASLTMGHFLSVPELAFPARYYAVGFYMYQGSARAWDRAAKIGVISHQVPIAPRYSAEHVFMIASGMPEIAWIPLGGLPNYLMEWLRIPRFVREVSAVYAGEEKMMTLRSLPEEFDAVVIVKQGHDSTPTPTGMRTAVSK